METDLVGPVRAGEGGLLADTGEETGDLVAGSSYQSTSRDIPGEERGAGWGENPAGVGFVGLLDLARILDFMR